MGFVAVDYEDSRVVFHGGFIRKIDQCQQDIARFLQLLFIKPGDVLEDVGRMLAGSAFLAQDYQALRFCIGQAISPVQFKGRDV